MYNYVDFNTTSTNFVASVNINIQHINIFLIDKKKT